MTKKINIPKIVSNNIQIKRVLSEDDKLIYAQASIEQDELSRSCKVVKRRITRRDPLNIPKLSNTDKGYSCETMQNISFENIKDKFKIIKSKEE